ncbi:MAG: hypothetical protein IKB88_04240 [Clostridia bacterium]|nr:hypothetical protein [Clostridia bacterium]
MDASQAWIKFSESGAIRDYLEFRNVAAAVPSEAEYNANDYRRSGVKSDGYRRKRPSRNPSDR